MKTNIELNIACAKVQGFTVQFNETKALYELLNPQGEWKYPHDADGEDEEHCWKYTSEYSTDANAALTLVEEMRKQGWSFVMMDHTATTRDDGKLDYHVTFFRKKGGIYNGEQHEAVDTFERAICLTFLAATEDKA